MRAGDLQMIDETDDVADHLDPIVRGFHRLLALPMAATVQGDDSVPGRAQRGGDSGAIEVPQRRTREAVNKHDGWASALIGEADPDVVGIKRADDSVLL